MYEQYMERINYFPMIFSLGIATIAGLIYISCKSPYSKDKEDQKEIIKSTLEEIAKGNLTKTNNATAEKLVQEGYLDQEDYFLARMEGVRAYKSRRR